MPSTPMLKAKGLHTFNNYLSSIPEGAQIEADNVIIDKDGVIEPRRGITQYGTVGSIGTDISKQLLLYKDRVLAHYQNKLAWDNGSGSFTDFSGTFLETETGLRIKAVEANSNLYLTTSNGVRKIAARSAATLGSATIGNAGGIKAITGTGVCDYSQPIFSEFSKVAYRITWGTKDVNGNFIEGVPSPAIEITNQAGDKCAFTLTFQVPNGITTDYFYRVYRTAIAVADPPSFASLADLETGDEMRLVIEDGYVSGTEITVTDVTPDSFREQNVNLYTNEFSGEGILQANEPPPYAKDIALFKNVTFYADTRVKHRLLFNLLGVGSFKSFGGEGDSVDITNISYSSPTTTITFSAAHGLMAGKKIVILGSGSALDGTRTIASVPTSTTITVTANGTGASATNCSVYGSYINISRASSSFDYHFVGRPEIQEITFVDKSTMVDGGYFILYSFENKVKYVFWFAKSGATPSPTGPDTEGAVKIRVDLATATTNAQVAAAFDTAINAATFDFITVLTSNVVRIINANSGTCTNVADGALAPGVAYTNIQDGHGEDAANRYVRLSTFISSAQNIDDTARSLTKVVTSNTAEVVNAYYIFKPDDVPGQMLFESKDLSVQAFSLLADSAATGASFNPNISTARASDNEESPNRLYYSKPSQPEAVPIVNYQPVGNKDKRIRRIIALRDSLFIFKDEGIYRLTGESSANYFITLFDNSATITAPDSAIVLNNQIYCLSTQGIIAVSETGVSVVSRPVENILSAISAPAFANYKSICFSAAYESDRAYFLWIPKDSEDEAATRCLRLNTFTGAWTSWSVPATCAIVDPNINKLYVGASDTNLIEVERKELNRNDYADRQYALTLPANAIEDSSLSVAVSSTALMEQGDVIRQTQYVTMSQVRRLVNKLALDAGVPNTVGNNNRELYRLFDPQFGCNLQAELGTILTQLNSDIGSSFPTSFSPSFATFQTEFNNLVDDMNLDPTLASTNYQGSTGTVNYEMLINSVDSVNSVTVLATQPFIEGTMDLFKSIPSTIVWAPMDFGNPSIQKHVRESTVLFDNAGLAFAELGFNSDLSSNFEGVDFIMEGDGAWGVFFYDSISWGGVGSGRPFRTLIPRQKQRCRFIRSKFTHNTAFYKYGILGISFAYEIGSERAYR